MHTEAIVLEAPGRLACRSVHLDDPAAGDMVVAIDHSGISTGTEKLLYEGRMPDFPGMGYPLVPGYEAVGTIIDANGSTTYRAGEAIFVPGARCFTDVRALFGGAAQTLVVPEGRVVRNIFDDERGILLALAATAYHAFATGLAPELIVGHGVVGRLMARIALATGAAPPTVWDKRVERRAGAIGYDVIDADQDSRRDYGVICDCSGDAALVPALIGRLAKGGELVLAGFYAQPISFAFAPAFMREARLRIAAEWQADDMAAVVRLIESGRLSLDGLISDREAARRAPTAYARAFSAPDCLKMILDWRPA